MDIFGMGWSPLKPPQIPEGAADAVRAVVQAIYFKGLKEGLLLGFVLGCIVFNLLTRKPNG